MILKRLKNNLESDFMKRQFYMMSNLGLFYIIIIAMFGIPLLGTFVVILIKGALDFRYLILAFGIIALSLGIYYTGRSLFRLLVAIRKDGLFSFREAQRRARTGESVQLDILGGLFSLSMGSHRGPAPILASGSAPISLPAPAEGVPVGSAPDPVRQLKELQSLYKEGVVNQVEFDTLKQAIVRQAADDTRLSVDGQAGVADPPGQRANGETGADNSPADIL